MSVLVYGFSASTYTRSARIALVEKGVEYQLQKVRVGTPEYAEIHPYQKMPVLEHNGFRVFEIAAILRYIDEAFEGPALQPAHIQDRALMMQWISAFNDYITPTALRGVVIPRLVRGPRGLISPDAPIRQAAADARQALIPFNERLKTVPYLAGEHFSLADIVVAPLIALHGFLAEEDNFMPGLDALRDWAFRLEERPSFAATRPV